MGAFMKRILLLMLFIGIFFMSATNHANESISELDTVKTPLQNYIRAQETGNADFIRQAFTQDAKVMGYMAGKFISWGVEEYTGRFTGKPADDEALRKRSFEVLDATEDAAVAKVVLDYPAVTFTDYMSLLKIDGKWKIVSKSFHAEMKTPPQK
jgi:Putative lumazine-binding